MVNDQAASLRQRVKQKEKGKQAKTIAIFSGKGGVGKSNFAVNFAICLSKQGKKVLIFDLDIGMGNVDVLLGLYPKHNLTTMFEKNLPISDIIEVGPGHLSYIASGNGLNDLFSMKKEQIQFFIDQLSHIAQEYDYFIFDLGAGMSEEHVEFISASDECIVISTPEPTSYMDAYSAMKHIIMTNPLVNMSLLINNASSTKEGEQTYNHLRIVVQNFLKYEIKLFGILPNDPIVSEAVRQQVPFYMLNPRAKISKLLAKTVLDYLKANNQDKQKEENKQFISKLKLMFTRKVD